MTYEKCQDQLPTVFSVHDTHSVVAALDLPRTSEAHIAIDFTQNSLEEAPGHTGYIKFDNCSVRISSRYFQEYFWGFHYFERSTVTLNEDDLQVTRDNFFISSRYWRSPWTKLVFKRRRIIFKAWNYPVNYCFLHGSVLVKQLQAWHLFQSPFLFSL